MSQRQQPEISTPHASVVVPMQNEAKNIATAIHAIAVQSFGAPKIQLVLVDGGSTDDTIEVAEACASQYPWAAVDIVSNTGGNTPSNLNAGLAASTGDMLIRVDARSIIPPDYVEKCVAHLRTAAVAGGRQIAIPNGSTAVARGIARALNNRYAMGGAAYRDHRSASGAVDTVYLGSFRTADLRLVGGWDEEMSTNQDFELNQRLLRQTGRAVWFDDSLRTEYVGRATLGEILRQYHRFGRWKVTYWRRKNAEPQARQWVLIVGPPVVAGLGLSVWVGFGLPIAGGVVVGLAALGTLEHAGSIEPAGGPAVRLYGAFAMTAVGIGWWTGVVAQASMWILDRR